MSKVKFKRFLSDGDLDDVAIDDGSFIVTKSGTSYIDYADERIAFGGTPDSEISSESVNSVQNKVVKAYVDDKTGVVQTNLDKIGKTLWTGSFSTGTLTVPNLNEYTMICVYVNNVMMVGNQYYGGTAFRLYRGASIVNWGYRFTYSSTNNTLKTDTDNPGASDGTNQLTITKIVGIF